MRQDDVTKATQLLLLGRQGPAVSDLTHLNERGEAHIVDIGGKAVTARRAVARAVLEAKPETIGADRSAARSRRATPWRLPASPASWRPRRPQN